jgi:hypothetical protein
MHKDCKALQTVMQMLRQSVAKKSPINPKDWVECASVPTLLCSDTNTELQQGDTVANRQIRDSLTNAVQPRDSVQQIEDTVDTIRLDSIKSTNWSNDQLCLNQDAKSIIVQLLDDKSFVEQYVLSNQSVVDLVVKDYLQKISKQPVRTVSSKKSSIVLTPFKQPKNLKEAKSIVDNYLY